jgi:hypothetical protein
MCIPKESAILSATANTTNEHITPVFGFADDNSPKIIPRLITVEDVAPKPNLLGSIGKLIKIIFRGNNYELWTLFRFLLKKKKVDFEIYKF